MTVTETAADTAEDPTNEAKAPDRSSADVSYLLGVVESLKDRLAISDERESRLEKSATKATFWFNAAIGTWTVILGLVLAMSAISSYRLDDVISEAKREVRDIAGNSRPDSADWGRIGSGDQGKLVFEAIVYEYEDGDASLVIRSFPKLDVFGATARVAGWRITLDGDMLDWYTSSGEFVLPDPSPQFMATEKLRREHYQHGTILWLQDNNDDNLVVSLPPDTSWSGPVRLRTYYNSCETALNAAIRLKNLSDEDELGRIGLVPVIENFATQEKVFDVEIIFAPHDEFECEDAGQPSIPEPELDSPQFRPPVSDT